MLQTTIFAEVQGTAFSLAVTSPLHGRHHMTRKGSFARLAAWSRELLVRDESGKLNDHLLRDIGARGHDGD